MMQQSTSTDSRKVDAFDAFLTSASEQELHERLDSLQRERQALEVSIGLKPWRRDGYGQRETLRRQAVELAEAIAARQAAREKLTQRHT